MQRTTNVLTLATAALILGLAAPASADTLTVVWDLHPETEVTGYIVHIGTEPGVYTSRIDVGNTTTYVLTTAEPGRRYCFAVSAYFPGPVEGSRSPEVCTDGNLAPTLANPGAQSSALGVATSLSLSATDPEGMRLTFSATGLPAGLSIAAATGVISGTPTTAGTSNVRASASDGVFSTSQDFTWTIGSSAPAAPTLVRPAGAISTTTPTFEWQAVASATRYRLWVDDSSAVNPRIQLDLTPAEVGCASGGAVCRSTPAVALAAGAASWSVRASNGAGDGPWSGAMDFSVPDGRAPAVTIGAPTSSSTFSTSSSTVALGGTANDDVSVVQVTWSNNRGGAGTANGTTAWTVPSIPLSTGSNVITVTARDGQNNVSTDVLTVSRSDGQAPTVEISLPSSATSHRTTDTTIALGGTASDEFGIREVQWSNSRGGSGVASGTVNWGVPAVPLQRGSNVITVTARDAAGNTATDTITVDVGDGVAPVVNIVTPAGATFETPASSMTLGGTASDAFGIARVTWASSRGGSGTARGTTGWSAEPIPLQFGEQVLTVTAYDATGLTGTDTLTVTRIDAGPPTIAITAPTGSPSYATGQETIVLGGTASDDQAVAEVTWTNERGGSGVAAGTSTWSIPGLALQGGTNRITVRVRDAAGKWATDDVVITRVDSDRPTVSITAPAATDAYSTANQVLNIGGTATDTSGITQVNWSNSRGGSGVATGTTAWSASAIALQPGANVITVVARDSAGNIGTDTLTVSLTDETAPTVTILVPTNGATHATAAATISLAGTAADAFGVSEVRWTTDRGASGSASGTTNWTTSSIALSAGANVITVTARDGSGRTGTDVLTVNRTDTEVPRISIATPTTNSTHATTLRSLALAGTASDTAGVSSVSWANDRGGSGVAAGTTLWTVPAVSLQPGSNVLTVTARDAAGNTASDTLLVTVTDGEAPTIRIVAPTTAASFPTTATTITVSGTATDASGVSRVTWTNSLGGDGTATGTTDWSITGLALKAGANVVTVTATDAAGNASRAILSITATDSTRPTVAIASPTADARYVTTSGSIALSGSARDDFAVSSVRWTSDRGGSGTAAGTTAWTIGSLALQPGANVITVTATDAAGNLATDVLTVAMDGRRPTVAISRPVSSATFAANSLTLDLAGSADDDQAITEVSWTNDRGGRGVAAGTRAWSAVSVPLAGGMNTITVTARDEAGNTGSAVLAVIKDSAAPGITIEGPSSAPSVTTSAATVTLRGAANDDVGVTQVTWASDRGGSGVATGATAWSASVPLLAGRNAIVVTARDAAGNTSTDTIAVTFDARAPVVSILTPATTGTFATSSNTVAIGGAVEDESPISEVSWTSSRGGSGMATGGSRWSIDRVALLAGVNDITVTARDGAGNTASARLRITATDAQAPAISIAVPSSGDSFATALRVINIEGLASDDFGVTQVAWASDRGVSGVARGTSNWLAGGVALQPGLNTIAVTAVDGAGRTATDVLRVTVNSQLPVVSITSPASQGSYTSAGPTVVVSGQASHETGIAQVAWLSDRGPSGIASGTTVWSTPPIRLEPGANVISVTAQDRSGNVATASLSINYVDNVAPVVSVLSPTGVSLSTSASAVPFTGVASDAFGVAQVSWSSDRGGSGVASGTTTWSVSSVPLAYGQNVITITARDRSGNAGTATVRMSRTQLLTSTSVPDTSPTNTVTQSTSFQTSTSDIVAAPTQGSQLELASLSVSPASTAPRTATEPSSFTRPPAPSDEPAAPEPAIPPTVAIAAPGTGGRHLTSDEVLTVAGNARHRLGITQVTWRTDSGASGVATGRERWTIRNLRLPLGTTVLTVTARNSVGDLASDVLVLVRQPANAAALAIEAPTSGPTWATAASTVALRGVASDNVVRVAWTADGGGGGTATGTTQWTIPTIGLQRGPNTITVKAYDTAGNSTERVLTVTYSPLRASTR